MNDTKRILVLHLVGTTEPLHVALSTDEAQALPARLPELLASGEPRLLGTADEGRFAVNFAHVATAHIEAARSDAHAYGAPSKVTGFSS